MSERERNAKISQLVAGYISGGLALQDYLDTVAPGLRSEVEAQCREAEFIDGFFREQAPARSTGDRPDVIGGCDLIEKLGEGAMGEVFRARQTGIDRDVAVKLVRGELLHREDFLIRFQREARTLAKLEHPGIVKVLSFGEEQGWHYFVMELVRGASLDAALPALREDHDRTARIFAELLEAIAYAHGRGVTHRDLKPSNVMLDESGRPRLVDFGLAKAVAEDSNDQLRTVHGVLLGTPAYLSPEAATQRSSQASSGDVWAAGVMLYQTLTERLPYVADSTDALLDMLRDPRWLDPRTTAPKVPSALAQICRRALAPHADDRYRSALDFAADLRRYLARETVDAERTWSIERVQRHAFRHRRSYGITAATLMTVGMVWFGARTVAAAEETQDAVDELLQGASVASQPMHELAVRAGKARELLAEGRLATEGAQQVRTLLASIEQRAQQEYDLALAEIRASGAHRTPFVAASPARQIEGVRRATAATAVLATPEAATALIGAGHPQLVIANPPGHDTSPVRIDALDATSGEVVITAANGTTPMAIALAPGDYRITVGTADAFAECMCSLHVNAPHQVYPSLIPTGIAQQGMCVVPAGTFQVGQDEPGAVVYPLTTVDHSAFFIDRTEVTCSQYHDYCQATNTPLPKTWDGAYQQQWQDLPVVGISMQEAQRYAEFVGKRLPTWTEWQIAARGHNGQLWPWGDTPEYLGELTSIGHDKKPWHEGLQPVGTNLRDVSWCGAMDMLANCSEWTTTPYVAVMDGAPFPFAPWRMTGGATWNSARDRLAALDGIHPSPPESMDTGFRCAKSATPDGDSND